jgi:hypothetical protein
MLFPASHKDAVMAEDQTCEWPGVSGKKYKYWVYPRHPKLKDEAGNYIYAKVNDKNQWVPVYIGEGILSQRATGDNHHRIACIDRKGGTHVHAHLNSREADRRSEEKDLLANFPQAYEPTGCNVKEGG